MKDDINNNSKNKYFNCTGMGHVGDVLVVGVAKPLVGVVMWWARPIDGRVSLKINNGVH